MIISCKQAGSVAEESQQQGTRGEGQGVPGHITQ